MVSARNDGEGFRFQVAVKAGPFDTCADLACTFSSGQPRTTRDSIAPNALVDGAVIFQADLGQEIDNMEGIDAHVTADGETVLTLVSDDNFSPLQRTLLLQFTLVE